MATNRPTWQTELLLLDSWTMRQALSALCGLDPDEAENPSEPARAELQRAETQVRSAIRAGTLTVLPAIGDPRLQKALETVDAGLADEIRRAALADRLYGSGANFKPDVLIAWATKPGRFLRCSFTVDDFLPNTVTLDTRERTSLAVIITALAHHAKIDITVGANAAAVIAADANALKLEISERTIATHLQRVREITRGRRG